MENLGTSLWITLLGMGLVFIAIILLWGLMAVLVRITQDKPEEVLPVHDADAQPADQRAAYRAKAAAAAVAAALAGETTTSYQGAYQPPSDTVSAWQSAGRNTPANN